MKHNVKKRTVLRPSPNEEVVLLQTEKRKRRKLRLQQVRDQEKAFANKLLQRAKERKASELRLLSENLKDQWQQDQEEKEASLRKKYQENLEHIGTGHQAASEVPIPGPRNVLSEEAIQRARERHRKALDQLMLEKAKDCHAEFERAENRRIVRETEHARAARIAALPTPADPVQDLSIAKGHRCPVKSKDSFASTHHHLKAFVQREVDTLQENARQSAVEEGERIDAIVEETRRVHTEQHEKARLRHNHALAQLRLEEDRKQLMEELDNLERCDRHRRQEAVAKIPVQIFQPPHKRLEDAEDHQRDLEQAFEDMYMMQTGYTGDLTVALEPPAPPSLIPDESLQSDAELVSLPEETEPADDRPAATQLSPAAEKQERPPPPDAATVPQGTDPLRRLLRRIQDQRETWQVQAARPQHVEEADREHTAGPGVETADRRERLPEHHERGSPSITVPREYTEPDDEDRVPAVPERREEHNQEGPHGVRTLLHPYEATRRSAPSTPLTREENPNEEALLEQQRLKLQLQQQNLLKQQLEQQLREYERQLQEMHQQPQGSGLPQEEHPQHVQPYMGTSHDSPPSVPGVPFRLTALEGLSEGSLSRRAPLSEAPQSSSGVSQVSPAGDGGSVVSSSLESLSSHELDDPSASKCSSEKSSQGSQTKLIKDKPNDPVPLGSARPVSRSFSSSSPDSVESEELSDVTSITVTASLQTPQTPSLSVSSPRPNMESHFVPPLREIPDTRPAFSAFRPAGFGVSSGQTAATGPAVSQGRINVTPSDLSSAGLSRSTSQTSRYSPSYLDYFRQKLEEERRLLAVQRNLINQKQEQHRTQLTRYSSVLSPMSDEGDSTTRTTPGEASVGVTHMDPSRRPFVRMARQDEPLSTVASMEGSRKTAFHSETSDKENRSVFANAARLTSEARLTEMTARLESLGKSHQDPLGRRSLQRNEETARAHIPGPGPTRRAVHVSDSSYSAHELTQSSSGTQYHSLPHSIHSSDVTADDFSRGRASSESGTSDLAELMTRLNSSNGESRDGRRNQTKSNGAVSGFQGVRAPHARTWITSLPSSSDGPSTADSAGTGDVSAVGLVSGAGTAGVSWAQALKNQSVRALPEPKTSSGSSETPAAEYPVTRRPEPSGIGSREWYIPDKASTVSSGTLWEGPEMPVYRRPGGSQEWYVPATASAASSNTLTPSEEAPILPGPSGSQGRYVAPRGSTNSSTLTTSEVGLNLQGLSGSQGRYIAARTSTISTSTLSPSEGDSQLPGPSGSQAHYGPAATNTFSAISLIQSEDSPQTSVHSETSGGLQHYAPQQVHTSSPSTFTSIESGSQSPLHTASSSNKGYQTPPKAGSVLLSTVRVEEDGYWVGQALHPAVHTSSSLSSSLGSRQVGSQAMFQPGGWVEPSLWSASSLRAQGTSGIVSGSLHPARGSISSTSSPGHLFTLPAVSETEEALGSPTKEQSLPSGEDNSSFASSSLATLSSGSLNSPSVDPGSDSYPEGSRTGEETVPSQIDAGSDASSGDGATTPTDASKLSSHSTEEQADDGGEELTPGEAAMSGSLQAAFSRHKQQFVRNSQTRVEQAKAKRHQVKPRVQLGKRVKPPARKTSRQNNA